jgi:glycine/D-amino acid oxidase-like deaminating enzyme
MDLHGGAPWWLIEHGLTSPAPPLTGEHRCEVLVIGAGVTGALLADALTCAGRQVVVVDRRDPGLGSTVASTALLQYETDVELTELIDLVGLGNAVRAYQLGLEAIRWVGALQDELGDIGFSELPSLYLASARGHRQRLQAEAAVRQVHGLPATFLSAEDVAEGYGFPSHGAILSTNAGLVDPLLLTRKLLDRAARSGASIHGKTTAGRCDASTHHVDVELSGGARVRADWVVFAGGYEVPQQLRDDLVDLHSTFALVTEPARAGRWNGQCLVWESARPYTYLRPAGAGRIMIGGEDVPFRNARLRDRMIPARTERLEKRLKQLLPDVHCSADYAWAGTFGETDDGLPYIGPQTSGGRLLFALGYGGNGITFSAIAAMLLTELISGHASPDAAIFALDRAG